MTCSNINDIPISYKVQQILLYNVYMYTKVQATNKVIGCIPSHVSNFSEFLRFPILFMKANLLNHLLPPTSPFPVLIIVSNFILLPEMTAFSLRIA